MPKIKTCIGKPVYKTHGNRECASIIIYLAQTFLFRFQACVFRNNYCFGVTLLFLLDVLMIIEDFVNESCGTKL